MLIRGEHDSLLRLLHPLSLRWPNIAFHIGCLNGLSTDGLDTFPPLPDRWRNTLILDLGIDNGCTVGEGVLHKMALRKSRSQED